MTFTVTQVYASRENMWAIEFDDGVTLFCVMKAMRNEARVDALIADHAQRGDDPEHTARLRAMIAAVREHEATL